MGTDDVYPSWVPSGCYFCRKDRGVGVGTTSFVYLGPEKWKCRSCGAINELDGGRVHCYKEEDSRTAGSGEGDDEGGDGDDGAPAA